MPHKDLLIKCSIEKAEEALLASKASLKVSLQNSQNRNYYAVFYIVLALAYLDGFQTGKHHQLLGWFNKEYIYKNKVFGDKLKTIYQNLLVKREKFDYSVIETPKIEVVEKDLEQAKFFVQTVKEYILKRLEDKSQ